jgi:hypothetical protein
VQADADLIKATLAGEVALINKALAAGANVDHLDSMGRLPLAIAAAKGDMPVLNRLLLMSASAAAKGGDGHTALYAAASRGHSDVVQRLLWWPQVDAEDMGAAAVLAAQRDNLRLCALILKRLAREWHVCVLAFSELPDTTSTTDTASSHPACILRPGVLQYCSIAVLHPAVLTNTPMRSCALLSALPAEVDEQRCKAALQELQQDDVMTQRLDQVRPGFCCCCCCLWGRRSAAGRGEGPGRSAGVCAAHTNATCQRQRASPKALHVSTAHSTPGSMLCCGGRR